MIGLVLVLSLFGLVIGLWRLRYAWDQSGGKQYIDLDGKEWVIYSPAGSNPSAVGGNGDAGHCGAHGDGGGCAGGH